MGVEVTVSPSGRLSIPADVRKKLGLEKGGKLMLQETEHGIVLSTFEQRLKRAREIYREMMEGKPEVSVDEFLAQKRADAALERY